MKPIAADMQIRIQVEEVYEAFIDPVLTGKGLRRNKTFKRTACLDVLEQNLAAEKQSW